MGIVMQPQGPSSPPQQVVGRGRCLLQDQRPDGHRQGRRVDPPHLLRRRPSCERFGCSLTARLANPPVARPANRARPGSIARWSRGFGVRTCNVPCGANAVLASRPVRSNGGARSCDGGVVINVGRPSGPCADRCRSARGHRQRRPGRTLRRRSPVRAGGVRRRPAVGRASDGSAAAARSGSSTTARRSDCNRRHSDRTDTLQLHHY